MSINTVQLTNRSIPQLLQQEDLLTEGNTATLTLNIPPTIQGPKRTENAKGRLWITDRRVIFVTDGLSAPWSDSNGGPPGYDAPPTLNSLEIGHTLLRSCTYNLPTFSANHIRITFLPSPSSNSLPDPGTGQVLEAKIIVGEGAGHAVWKRIEGERSRAEERGRDGEDLPAYDQGPSGPPPTFDPPLKS
ncbi:hypothetical protein C349_06744 [Cryptococcus neoformans var. grubii Br795]|uniref:Uncharacterized protein n=1 Tax=Cryptococcus neoformans Tu259-1 TaxID=1230072 RepID=A0A854Q4N9_CRYNE|nr:hypothetical protein C353_06655 [Cryptococcus neoformans var. grubii AD1-83a]OWZ50307.1 hypothetical protein C368_06445 [Cryptococcus neoformans var. grubii 125.91]OXG10789.1 hypothetical protein C361_06824 [Cryptococcus neoformans var. grubii Tu259-1]OXG26361.1 hypothetical protein C360_06965 [Cryptococcus neoformans var. grubii Bt15]OXG33375.1 hypothetical protein C359_06600 [Cryptococcus neoformans var. grubii Bt120]OXG45873.1 hypothetical protein C354_06638 [Cryptococcus neoformans var.